MGIGGIGEIIDGQIRGDEDFSSRRARYQMHPASASMFLYVDVDNVEGSARTGEEASVARNVPEKAKLPLGYRAEHILCLRARCTPVALWIFYVGCFSAPGVL